MYRYISYIERVKLKYSLSDEYLTFLKTRNMRITLASHSLTLKSADEARIRGNKLEAIN